MDAVVKRTLTFCSPQDVVVLLVMSGMKDKNKTVPSLFLSLSSSMIVSSVGKVLTRSGGFQH